MFATDLLSRSYDSVFFVEALFDCMARLDGKSRLLVDRAGKLVASSQCAAAIFEAGAFLVLERGTVQVPDGVEDGAFRRLLGVTQPATETAVLRSANSLKHMMARAAAFDDRQVCINLATAVNDDEPMLPNLEATFGLTPSEARIVGDLYLGHTPQRIALDHRNSIHTIRAHIRRCYDKLEVSCREELWSKLNAYRLR